MNLVNRQNMASITDTYVLQKVSFHPILTKFILGSGVSMRALGSITIIFPGE